MGVRVHLPLRIRWPGDAPPDSGPAAEALDAALERGLGAALDRVRGEIFAPRGGFARPLPLPPSFAWQDEKSLIDGPARALLEARVAAAIRSAIADHPLVEDGRAPEVLPDGPNEPVGGGRMRGLEYRLHSYDGEPDEADIQVESDPPPATSTSTQNVWWHWDGTDDALFVEMSQYIEAFHSETRPARVGAIFHGTHLGQTGFWAMLQEVSWHEAPQGEGAFGFVPFLPGRWRREFLLAEFKTIRETGYEPQYESPDGAYSLRTLQPYSSPGQLRTIVREPILRTHALPLSPPAGEPASRSRLRNAIESAIDRFVAEYGGLAHQVVTRLGTPRGSGYYLVMPVEAMLGHDEWTLQGLSQTVEVQRGGDDRNAAAAARGGGQGEGEGHESTERTDNGDGAEGGEGASGATSAGEAHRGPLYPQVRVGNDSITLDLSPFLDEPHVDELFGASEAVKRLIRRIAYRLEMPEGEYCGAFLIAAARMINARANGVGELAEVLPRSTQQVAAGAGNLGDVEMAPEHTPAIELMRFIGGTCPLIRRLTRLMSEVYSQPQIYRSHFGRYQGNPTGWLLHFHEEHTPEMETGVGYVFMRTCQVTMLQLLRSSAREIDLRLGNFDRYFPLFEGVILGFVATEAELQLLRETLQNTLAVVDPSLQHTVGLVANSWREARRALSMSISDALSEIADGPDEPSGQVHRRPDGTWAIVDSRDRDWTMADLESAIAMRSQAARAIDPLINQLTDIPEVVDVFRNHPERARDYLRDLLTEMRDSNLEVRADVLVGDLYAFRSGKIREDLPNRTVPNCRVALQGIHLLAHQAIGDAFEGDAWYGAGLDWAFVVELGRLGLISFFETSIILGLSVLCPPAGAALGAVLAIVHYEGVEEQFAIRRAVMNPDELYDRAELELDLFMAEFEVVLSIVPELGNIARGAARGAGVLRSHGMGWGARRLGVEARHALLESMTRQLKHGLVLAFVEAIVTDQVMGMLLPQVLSPVIEAVDAEVRMMTAARQQQGGPPSEPSRPVATGDRGARPTAPQAIEFSARLDEYHPSPAEEVRRPEEDQP